MKLLVIRYNNPKYLDEEMKSYKSDMGNWLNLNKERYYNLLSVFIYNTCTDNT